MHGRKNIKIQEITVSYLTHKTRLHFTRNIFELQYIGYWSHTKDDRLFPAQTTAKVNCKLLIQYQYLQYFVLYSFVFGEKADN